MFIFFNTYSPSYIAMIARLQSSFQVMSDATIVAGLMEMDVFIRSLNIYQVPVMCQTFLYSERLIFIYFTSLF